MPAKTKLTFDKIPDVDSSPDLFDGSEKTYEITRPDGNGWKHEDSFLGNNSIISVWKKGTPDFDDGYELYWTGAGDDIVTNQIGEGSEILIQVSNTDEVDKYVDIEFIPDETYLYGGQAMWSGTQLHDSISLVVVAKANVFATLGNDDLILDNGRAKYVGVGNGTHSFTDIPILIDNKEGLGYWNYDIESGLMPAVNGDGKYDIIDSEKTVARLINKVPTSPNTDSYVEIASVNAWKILYGYKFRFIAHVNASNKHAWSCSLFLSMFRKSTI